MAINTNTNPYYNDFEESKNYLQILFKPGYAVQARELTQLQTAIQKQIARFGGHVFKDGSIVLNGNTTTTPCKWVDVTTEDGSLTVGQTFVGQTSGAQAKIFAYKQKSATVARLYFVYSSGSFFAQNENIQAVDTFQLLTIVNTTSYAGSATAFSIEDSVFFIGGYFAFCQKQTHILNDTGALFNSRVGLTVEEKIVTIEDDSTLLDPSQGSYNFAAPGADRIAIDLTLSSFTYDPLLDSLPSIDNFIELARFTQSVLTFNQKTSTYNELEKTLARRTYDESGDYTVQAFSASAIDHIGGDATKFTMAIGPGKAYVKGFEFETTAASYISVPRAQETKAITNHSVDVSYGDFFVVKTPVNADLDYTSNAVLELRSSGTLIGTCNVRNLEPVSTGRYKLFVYNVKLNTNYATSAITAFTVSGSTWFAEIDTTYYTNGVVFEKAPNRTGLIKLPNSYVKTLLDPSLVSNTEIESVATYTAAVNSSGVCTISAGADRTFITTFKEDYVIVNSATGQVLTPTSVALSTGNTVLTITLAVTSINVSVYAPVIYSNLVQKNKALQTITVTVPASADKISLGYSDCRRVTSIIAKNSQDATSETVNVTSKYGFNNGQTDEMYLHGSVKLKSGQTIPSTCDVIVITFEYFTQDKTNGFFSADSYPLTYDKIPTFTSATGEKYRLADCLDFRPRQANNSTTVVGNGIAIPKSRISLDYEFYLPRIDKLVLTKEKKFDVIKGIPSEQPRIPTDLYDAMTLYVLTLPAYTATPSEVVLSYIDNKRYTMRDIGKISKRVEKIEYYTALSLLEKQANDEALYTNLGVERFKNGILVDSFSGHSVGEVTSPDYSCSINKESRLLRPRFSSWSYGYTFASGSALRDGDLVTLPIASTEILANQPYATNAVNVNPYLVFSWEGRVSLNPPSDTWVDTTTRPDVVVNLNGTNDVYTTLVPNVTNPASTGVVWNDWQTVVRGVDVTQTITNQEVPAGSVIDGIALDASTNAISSTIQTTTESSSFRTGIEISTSAVSTVQRDLGTKVVDTSITPYIRSRLVDFSAINLKPSISLYALFDNVQVQKYCTPAIQITLPVGVVVPSTAKALQTVGAAKSARILLARGNTLHVILNTGSANFVSGDSVQWIDKDIASTFVTISSVVTKTSLATDAKGDIAGTFLIPNDSKLKFTTGEKAFRLVDNLSNRPRTAAEVKYVALGLSQSLEKTLVSTRVATASVKPVQEVSAVITDTTTSQVLLPVDPIRIVCSEDENTGDFSNGEAGKTEYLLSYENVVKTSANGAVGSSQITVLSNTGINVGMKVSGVGINPAATVTVISGTTITLSDANTGTVAGSLNVTFTNIWSWLGIKYIPTDLPVKYTLYFEGNEYTTGYVGSSAYNSKLNALGLPNVSGAGNGLLYFQRGDASFTQARLVVDSPLAGSDWQFSVPCPLQASPSTEMQKQTFAIAASATDVIEGSTVTFNITTSNVTTGTVLDWEIVGLDGDAFNPAAAGDFTDGLLTGSVTISGNKGSFTKTLSNDITTEGNEKFQVILRSSGGASTLAKSGAVLIRDTSVAPSYQVITDKAVLNEGQTVKFTVKTTGVANGTTLYWDITGDAGSADFTDGLVAGTVVINNNTATVSKTVAADATTEGAENFVLNVRTVSAVGSIVATSSNVSITDSSISTATYSIQPNVFELNEGSTVLYNVITTNVANGTTLYWVSSGLTTADFSDAAIQGSFVVTNNIGQISRTLVADSSTGEGPETLAMVIKTVSTSGTTVATSPTVRINDTSTSTSAYDVSPNITAVNEGSSVIFTVNTKNVANGTVLYWRTVDVTGKSGVNAITADDFTDGLLAGSVTINSNTATFTRAISATDDELEDTAAFNIELWTAATGGTQLDSSASVTITNVPKVRNASVVGSNTSVSIPSSILSSGDNAVTIVSATPTTISVSWKGSNFDAAAKYYVTGTEVYLNGILNTTLTAYFNPATQATQGVAITGTLTAPAGLQIDAVAQQTCTVKVTMQYVSGDSIVDAGKYNALKTLVGECSVNITIPDEVLFGGELIRENDTRSVYTDPVAQTFRIDEKLYPNGVFVKSLDLFFRTKSASAPVSVELRTVVNGYPSSKTIIPFSTASMVPAAVAVSTNGTAATTFTFENIIYLAPGEEYAFVVLSNSDEYEIFTAVLGEFSLQDTTKRVDKQPVLGSMFKSQNSSTWTPVQEEDVKFVLRKCVFPTSGTANAVLNTAVETTNGNVPYDVFYATGENLDFAATNIDYAFNNGSGWVSYQLGSNVSMSAPKTLVSATPSSLQLRATLSTTDKHITPVVDLSRLSNVLVHNIVNNDSTDETGEEGGNAVAKYVTKKVKLAPGFDATDLKVYLFANVPTSSSIKVYYKVSISTDPFFDDNQYVEMQIENAGSYSENSFVEYKYKTPFLLDAETVAIETGDRFDTFAIKIVMLSSDTTKVPQIRDLRVIALDQ